MRRPGFTLVELSLVVAVIALTVGLSVPTYDLIVRRARAAEARATLESIAHAELMRFRDHGAYLACGGDAFDPAATCWRELAVRFEGAPRYRYSVEVAGGSFTAIARGDQDGDGRLATYRLDGATLRIATEDELE